MFFFIRDYSCIIRRYIYVTVATYTRLVMVWRNNPMNFIRCVTSPIYVTYIFIRFVSCITNPSKPLGFKFELLPKRRGAKFTAIYIYMHLRQHIKDWRSVQCTEANNEGLRKIGKGKVFPLQAWSGSWGSRRLRLLDLLDFRHCEGGKVVTLTHRPSLPPGVSWYSFLEAESTPGHMVSSVASEKIPSDTNGDQSRDLPTSSTVP
jgi:hypothetical protein